MKTLDTYILEKFKISKDIPLELSVEDAFILKKIKYVLHKFYNTWDFTLYEDHQGETKYYGINIDSLPESTNRTAYGMVRYFEKIPEVPVQRDNGFTKVGSDSLWIKFYFGKQVLKDIRVSELFFSQKPFKINNSKVAERGWSEWQKQKL